jgi:hypothetical protein
MKRLSTTVLFFIITLGLTAINGLAQEQSREDLLKEIQAKRAELQRFEDQLLATSEQDRVTYSDFLQQADTGLVRLLPREIYDSSAHPESGLTIRGGGSYYSFTRLTHEYGWGTQIGLEQDQLKTSFAGADYGMLTSLGDVPLETVNLEHPAVKELTAYKPPSDEPFARREYTRFAAGESINGAEYKTQLPAVVNRSYVVRGIHYSDSDVLVAFRIVRKDSDGSLIIAWKILRKFPKPELARN